MICRLFAVSLIASGCVIANEVEVGVHPRRAIVQACERVDSWSGEASTAALVTLDAQLCNAVVDLGEASSPQIKAALEDLLAADAAAEEAGAPFPVPARVRFTRAALPNAVDAERAGRIADRLCSILEGGAAPDRRGSRFHAGKSAAQVSCRVEGRKVWGVVAW